MEKLLLPDLIKNLLKFSPVQTDNAVFRLHYKLTATLLFGCSILVSATQFFGDPIYCLNYDLNHRSEIMNSYCWIEGTITLPRSLNGTLDSDVASPGVDQRKITKDEPVIEHSYYQWVALFLFFQAVCFYAPRWLWEHWECGRMKYLINELSKPALRKKEKRQNIRTIVAYFVEHRFEHQSYAYKFFFCEILNLVNIVVQMFLLDRFLNFQFWTYGPSAIAFLAEDPEVRVDPMSLVFPKVTKCRLKRFGTSGEVQTHDAICLLSLNIINEKIFVFLWFWFVILLTVTIAHLIYRSLVIKAPKYRSRLLGDLKNFFEPSDDERKDCSERYGDWFMLSLLKDNVKAHNFKSVVRQLSPALKEASGETDKQKLLPQV